MGKHREGTAKGSSGQNKPEHDPKHADKKTAKDTGYVGKRRER